MKFIDRGPCGLKMFRDMDVSIAGEIIRGTRTMTCVWGVCGGIRAVSRDCPNLKR